MWKHKQCQDITTSKPGTLNLEPLRIGLRRNIGVGDKVAAGEMLSLAGHPSDGLLWETKARIMYFAEEVVLAKRETLSATRQIPKEPELLVFFAF